MARSDYAHWNEEQDIVWWQEEGRFGNEPPPYCDNCGFQHQGECPWDDDFNPDDDDEETDPDDES